MLTVTIKIATKIDIIIMKTVCLFVFSRMNSIKNTYLLSIMTVSFVKNSCLINDYISSMNEMNKSRQDYIVDKTELKC